MMINVVEWNLWPKEKKTEVANQYKKLLKENGNVDKQYCKLLRSAIKELTISSYGIKNK